MLAIAGWPNCKSVYEANLAEAEATAKYCRELCNGPARGGRDLKFNQRQLEHALEMREWRRRLLDGLNKVITGDRSLLGSGGQRRHSSDQMPKRFVGSPAHEGISKMWTD